MKTNADALENHSRKLLQEYFGYTQFRNGQFEIIHSIFDANDTLVVMPTGGGKSLCYQIPAMMREGVALVISPLIALMKDQVDALSRAHVPASFINSSLHLSDIQKRMNNARFGAYKLLYIAPERLESRQFVEELASLNISFLAVDEAHCISEWGHDFRPSYLSIPKALENLKRVPVIALTATATEEVRRDIVSALHMKDVHTFVKGFDRPNLRYVTVESDDKNADVERIVRSSRDGASIVYCGSRRKVDEYAKNLQARGVQCLAYHAGMHEVQRTEVQEKFIQGEVQVLTATSAFGMGVDKSDVRNVIHTDLTLTLEAYYQEAGRAGRDGLDSTCTVLYQRGDRRLQEFFIKATYPELSDIKSVYTFLYDSMGVARGEKAMNAIYMDEVVIGNRLNLPAATVSSVLNVLERAELLRRGLQQHKATLQLLAEPERLKEYFYQTTPERREVLEALLRGVGPEALRGTVTIDMQQLVRKHDLPYDQLHKAIRAFEFARLMRYVPAAANGGIVLTQIRSAADHIPIDYKGIEERRQRALKKLDVVQRYVETHECKRNFILEYFEDHEFSERCGRCSSCTTPPERKKKRSQQDEFVYRTIVSCTLELQERFGRHVLSQVLAGQENPKVLSFGLHKSQYFGVLKELGPSGIIERIDQAMRTGLLRQSVELYPRVLVNASGRDLLGGVLPEVLPQRYQQREHEDNDELIEKLKRVRHNLAALHECSAQGILSDAQIVAIARRQPSTANDFRRIPGLSTMFISRFADEFLRALRENKAQEEQPQALKRVSASVQATIALLNEGNNLSTIAELRGLSIGSVAAHIQEAIELGVDVQRSTLITDDVFDAVRAVIRRKPRALLKDLRLEIGADIDFAELRVAAALARRDIEKN